jgi:2,4-dichlorophenol 6-monooxygenase
LITHFINPEGETMVHFDCGALVKMGPTWDRHSEEWVLHFGFPVTDSKRFETEALPSRIRQLLKLPDLEMEVLRVSHWVLERTLASKYSEGRIFIAGDAAHKRPPTTGLGLNTAIEDALNLAWKLAFVVGGKASPALLDTYSLERRPIGLRNCDWGLFTFSNFPVLQAAVGLLPGEKEYNQQRFARIFEDSPYGKTARHHLARIFATQDIEFAAHNIELGFSYDTGAVVPDATRKPEEDYGGRIYNPTTRPGHRLPHVWIERDGKVISTHDLIGAGQHDFFLISDEAGKAWLDAARRISKTSNVHVGVAAIKAHRSTIDPSCFEDYDDEWAKVREFEDGGAILVRPDNFVCWRSHGPSMQDGEELLRAIQAVLVERTPIDNEEAYVSVNGDNKSLVNGY